MKRRDLIKILEEHGWYMLRDIGDHTIYTNGEKKEPIPRHREVNEQLAKAILKRNGLL